jgi:hypothetical protein
MTRIRYELRSMTDFPIHQFDTEEQAKQWAAEQWILHGDKQPILKLVRLEIHEELLCHV